jgi:hydroxysqualene dehydroxylase
MSSASQVAVVGGGLAGITAALRLADAGHRVVLLEGRPKLGGLTHSFAKEIDEGTIWVDNGQHVFLRCCTSYRALLDRLGVPGQAILQDRLDVPVGSEVSPKVGRIRRTGLPAPLHLGASLAVYPWLSARARARVVPAALAMGRVDRDAPATDQQSFGDWLTAHGQSPRAVEALWDLIGIATLNAPAERASLALAATVFQLGLLSDAGAADIGWADVPLQQLHGDAAAAALAAAGVEVRLSTRVGSLEEVEADVTVLAVPAPDAARLAPHLVDPQAADALGAAPIINLHLVYDRPVMDGPFLAAVDSPLQWIFDRTRTSGLRSGQYLAISVSAAEEYVDVPVAQLRETFLPHVEALLPRARGARLRELFVTRERTATFRPAPGTARLRPPARTADPTVYLAGAWTATGWPATMEGAVRSGDSAARAVLEDHLDHSTQPGSLRAETEVPT